MEGWLYHACNIVILYITGEEFQAVFLSTTEPVDSEGNTTNPTKSPCDPYVFNTILTRSRSLVVVVGSPLALLKIEKHMVKSYGRKAYCWSSFIRACLEKRTFVIPPVVEPNAAIRQELVKMLTTELLHCDISDVASKLAVILTKHSSKPAARVPPTVTITSKGGALGPPQAKFTTLNSLQASSAPTLYRTPQQQLSPVIVC